MVFERVVSEGIARLLNASPPNLKTVVSGQTEGPSRAWALAKGDIFDKWPLRHCRSTSGVIASPAIHAKTFASLIWSKVAVGCNLTKISTLPPETFRRRLHLS